MTRVARPVLILVLLGLVAAGCSDGDPESEATAPSTTTSSTPPTPTTSTTTSTTTSSTTSTQPDPGPDVTDDTDAPAGSDDSIDSSSPETGSSVVAASAPPTTSAVTTTTEALMVEELVLTDEGLGSAQFGAPPEDVIEYVTSVLGGTTDDTGWVDPFSFADCAADGAATQARRVDWGVLSLLFADGSAYGFEGNHFIGYEYGRVDQIGDEPVGLHTPGNVGLGSQVRDVYAEFPDAAVNEGDDDIGIPSSFYVSDVFYGLLTGPEPDDVVTVIFGGYGCGG